MDIEKLKQMTLEEIEKLEDEAKNKREVMFTNLNTTDEEIQALDKEIVMKELRFRELKAFKTMQNRNLRVLDDEIQTINKYKWKSIKGD